MIEFRISDFIFPHRLLYWRWLLWKSQYYPLEKLKALQWRLFARLLDHCFENVPYYKRLFADIGLRRSDFTSLKDITKIPVLGKDVLLDRNNEFRAENFQKYNPIEIHTSGTTGTPLRVYWDRDSNVLELTSMWRHFSWAGYRLGEPFLDIRSVLMDDPNGYKWNWKCRGLEMSSDIINDSNIEKYAEIVRKHRVTLWRGHPSAIYSFCWLLNEAGITDIKPNYISTASEALLENQRNFIESWASVPICDNFGLKEHNALICQCPEGGYHIVSEYGIVEIIRDDGKSAQSGEEGRLVATGLHNKAFPLLRYDTRDYATVSDRTCACGRTLPLVEKLTGRIDDRVLTADNRWISGLHFAFFLVKGVRLAQLVQKQAKKLDVYLVPNKDYTENTEAVICGELKKKLGESMQICIHQVEDIPFRSSGKFKFVINDFKHDPWKV